MQSSSRLFPVTLSATEMAGKLYEDVYHMKPGVSSDPTVRLAVTRVRDPAWQGERFPVVLLHSEFHNRRLWLTPQGRALRGFWRAMGLMSGSRKCVAMGYLRKTGIGQRAISRCSRKRTCRRFIASWPNRADMSRPGLARGLVQGCWPTL